jgi:hypothetical protein
LISTIYSSQSSRKTLFFFVINNFQQSERGR